MGLFKALIVIAIGLFVLSLLEDKNSKLNNSPIIKSVLGNKITNNKCIIVILSIAFVEFIL